MTHEDLKRAAPISRGELHTRIMEAAIEAIEADHPGARLEDSDCELVIPSGCTPQTAYVKVDVSAIAEAALSVWSPLLSEIEALRAGKEEATAKKVFANVEWSVMRSQLESAERRALEAEQERDRLREALPNAVKSAFYEGYRQGTQANPIWDGDEADQEQDRQWEISYARAALRPQGGNHEA